MAQVAHGSALEGLRGFTPALYGFTPALTSFVGRAEQVDEVAALLAEYPLVTVTGPGGVGKTRLAAEVARRVAGRFADGAWLAELASVREPSLVLAAVATALGLRQAPGTSIRDSMTAVLARQQLLLVLDNCEHVLDAVAEICGWLLPAADDVRILATSREPIGVAGETRFRLGPLALPGPDEMTTPSAAVVLFNDRARRVDPHFTLSGESGPAVARLVQRLDGIPLAIELAAARVETLGVTQLLERLDDRFGLLIGTDRRAAARHGSLAAAVEWSYQLLSEPEQRAFRRLAIFPGPFALAAAEAVAGDGAANALLHLVDCSLVAPPRTGPDGRPRYLMLETLRVYGAERLAQAAEHPETAAALARYALGVAEQAAAGLETSDGELPAALWLDAEDATVHQVLAWAMEHDPDTALRLAIALAPWWRLRGRFAAGYALLAAAVAAAPVTPGEPAWCSAQLWLGNLAGNHTGPQALDHYTALRDVLSDRPPSPMLVRSLNGRASYLANTGRLTEAADEAHQALDMARDLGYAAGQAVALYWLTGTLYYTGDYQASLAWARQVQQLDQASLPPSMVRRCTLGLALALVETGDTDGARRTCEQALAAARQAGDWRDQADCLVVMTDLDLRTGQVTQATAWLREALEMAGRIGNELMVTDCLDLCALLCAQTRRGTEAFSLWAAAEASLRRIGAPDVPADAQRRAEAMSRVRQDLTPAQVQSAQERGAAMTVATAAEFAAMVLAGEPPEPQTAPDPPQLSARERELVTLVAQGRTNAQIAAQLFISVRTVGSHLDRIRDKTGCRRRADLTRLALQTGLV